MGSYSEEPEFKTLTIKPLHPTFGAEVEGVNFQNLSDEQFQEILLAMAKVRERSRLAMYPWPSRYKFKPPPLKNRISPTSTKSQRANAPRFQAQLTPERFLDSTACVCSATPASTMRATLNSPNASATWTR